MVSGQYPGWPGYDQSSDGSSAASAKVKQAHEMDKLALTTSLKGT